jgi:aminoglycoside N3'-acetyltransferase
MLIMELFNIPSEIDNVLVHTDVLKGMKFTAKNRITFLNQHYEFILNFIGKRNFYFPSFNYLCLKSGDFDIQNDKVQVGILNEYLRENKKLKRSPVPVFNFLANNDQHQIKIENGSIIDPFGEESLFHFLYVNESYLLHYGSSLSSSTIIHYVERMSNNLIYRYDKNFDVKIIDTNQSINVKFNYHVRPIGLELEYDWIKLENDLKSQNIIDEYKDGRTNIIGIRIKDLVNYWLGNIIKDPLYLLDAKTKFNVKKKIKEIGRNFLINDFE